MNYRISRREATKVVIVATIGSLSSIHGNTLSAQTSKRTRYGVHTPDGQRMLGIYADAVRAMADPTKYSEGDPRSWTFQWYTHAIRGDRTKAQEIQRIYNGKPEAEIARAMWDTCEAHTNSDRENFFLPWHRMYVQYFEEIVRRVTGKNEFTLPYWDYTDKNSRSLPAEFRKNGDAKWGALFRAQRNQHANSGMPIDGAPGALPIELDAMKSNSYEGKGGDAGFCANLDGGLHGAIHVDVGNGQGMGSVPFAARDPIFWLHHCNIDRVWASWSKSGGGHPSDSAFLGEMFTFSDGGGQSLKAKVQDFLELTQYEYDSHLDRPAGSLPFTTGPQPVAQGFQFNSVGKINLGSQTTTIKLGAATLGPGGGPMPVAAPSIRNASPEVPVHLRIEGLRAHGPTSAAFDVYVGPPQAKRERTTPSFVGSINFFGADHGPASGQHPQGSGRTVSFLLSPQTRQLFESESGPAQVTLVPRNDGKQGQPEIGRISLVAG